MATEEQKLTLDFKPVLWNKHLSDFKRSKERTQLIALFQSVGANKSAYVDADLNHGRLLFEEILGDILVYMSQLDMTSYSERGILRTSKVPELKDLIVTKNGRIREYREQEGVDEVEMGRRIQVYLYENINRFTWDNVKKVSQIESGPT
ncbi:MAG: hypothetical protein M1834_004252 [Cirrosporium novae-zelandiae]|nr:MAG: hypothetical protein M1834_004252 [Cirrosporium novae-zelandiae]